MRNKLKRLFTVIAVCSLCLMLSVPAYAKVRGNTEDARWHDGVTGKYTSVDEAIRAYGTRLLKLVSLTESEGDTSVEVDGKKYYYDTQDENQILWTANNYYTNSEETSNFVNVTDGLGIQADTGTAAVMLSGFSGFISTFLGILVMLLCIGMTVFTAFDLCYIAFPVFRNNCEAAKTQGSSTGFGKAMTKQGSNGESQLRFISDDAQYAVAAAETVQSGKNPFIIYGQKRIVSFCVLSVLIFILLTGNITIFTNLALKAVSGILEAISSI